MRKYLTCAETAKMVRAALREAFPGVKFSVRSDVYSGGASIDVRWTDGPSVKQVRAVTWLYEGSRFNGMCDLKYAAYHAITADGRLVLLGTGFDGQAPGHVDPVPEGAQAVSLGADCVMPSRHLSDEYRAMLEARPEAKAEACLALWGGDAVCVLSERIAPDGSPYEAASDVA
jgi:hypothetical protein